MRLSLSVNGVRISTASLKCRGHLGAHLNLSDGPGESQWRASVVLSGFDTTNDTETVSLKWPGRDLKVGDVVQLEVLGDGEGDPPTEQRLSSELPSNLLTSPDLARELCALTDAFSLQLTDFLQRAQAVEPEAEYKKLVRAVGEVLMATGDHLLHPVYRRHKELVPDTLRGEPL